MSTHRADLGRVAVAFAVVLALAGPAWAHAHDTRDLRDELTQVVETATDSAVGRWAVLVVDQHGELVVAHREHAPMLPASTMKTLTAAAALRTLGASTRLPTHLEATGPIYDGVLHGDLVLVGGGDPMLSTDEFIRFVHPERPATRLADLADALVDRGVTTVTGGVVGYAPRFVGPPTPAGWLDRYFVDFDARLISGLTVDAGLRSLVTWPPPPVDVEGIWPGLEEFDGLEPVDVRVEHADDPALHAAAELRRLLEQRGVEIGGTVRAHGTATVVSRLSTVYSEPVVDLVRFSVQFSDNHLADTLLHVVGLARVGEGSWRAGTSGLRTTLDELSVERSGTRMLDGSGLSRANRLTAATLVELDRAMFEREPELWPSVMAVMGRTGTLRHRLRGTVADGAVVGKTGSLRDVMAFSGAVLGDTERFHVAVLAEDVEGADRLLVRQVTDELLLVLSAHVRGCWTARDGDALVVVC